MIAVIDPSVLVLVTALYLGLLFWIAFQGDKKPIGQYSAYQSLLFTLSLAVYCSSWTFFGAVGTAVTSGWDYTAIYLGPILVMLFGHRFIERIVRISKREKTTTIADFIAARYGKSSALAALVTLIALVGTIPYIALQLKAVSAAFDTLTGRPMGRPEVSLLADTSFYLSIVLMVFAILFGARRIDATEHHRGLMNAISFESVVKITALMTLALFSFSLIESSETTSLAAAGLSFTDFTETVTKPSYLTMLFLAGGAIICLPRQFHVTAVESRGDEMGFARWGFSLYLIIVTLAVLPVTLAGIMTFNATESSDLFILWLPMNQDASFFSVLVYIGGFSAATSMVIVATVAMSTMVSNDLILPLLLHYRQNKTDSDYFPLLLKTRQVAICVLIALGYGYHSVAKNAESLASIGLISFAAAAQFIPAMVGAVYWRRGHRTGVLAGLIIGFGVWFYTLMMPTLAQAGWLPFTFTEQEAFGLFNPYSLFASDFGDPLTHGVFWSLSLNTLTFLIVSLIAKARLTDRMQAAAFIDGVKTDPRMQATVNQKISINDLKELCNRFVGTERTRRFFHERVGKTLHDRDNVYADVALINAVEQLLSSTIGASSARSIINTALKSSGPKNDDILNFLAQTTQAIQFNRELLQVTLDNLSQGVSAVDKDLRLVAWNQTYVDMFAYPEGFIKIGMPIEEMIRYNLRRELFRSDLVVEEVFVKKRLDYLRHGSNYSFERTWKNGTVIKTQGNRLPDGGFVTTYTDITDYKQAEKALEVAKNDLERKVIERTRTLSEVNKELADAKAEADEATLSKTRFLAAASHDLLQPLNAGKLFLGALLEDLKSQPDQTRLAENVQESLQSAEDLLRALLDISKLDAGALQPEYGDFALSELLRFLEREFSVLAEEKGLNFRVVDTDEHVYTDKNLLRSILQNFISNAIRYTRHGAVMVCCRTRDDKVMIQVRDSGPGIPEPMQEAIFEEFKRLDKKDSAGLGLGLAITQRIASLLDVEIRIRSASGRGSTFSILVERANTVPDIVPLPEVAKTQDDQPLEGLNILWIDDDPKNLVASSQLLKRWRCHVLTAQSVREWQLIMSQNIQFDVVVADNQLNDSLNGYEILQRMRERLGNVFMGIIISAEHDEKFQQNVRNDGFVFIPKPVDPATLRVQLNTLREDKQK